jgi:hypothetical protein
MIVMTLCSLEIWFVILAFNFVFNYFFIILQGFKKAFTWKNLEIFGKPIFKLEGASFLSVRF